MNGLPEVSWVVSREMPHLPELKQVLTEQLEYEGAPMHLEPKMGFVIRKKAERKSKAEVIHILLRRGVLMLDKFNLRVLLVVLSYDLLSSHVAQQRCLC